MTVGKMKFEVWIVVLVGGARIGAYKQGLIEVDAGRESEVVVSAIKIAMIASDEELLGGSGIVDRCEVLMTDLDGPRLFEYIPCDGRVLQFRRID